MPTLLRRIYGFTYWNISALSDSYDNLVLWVKLPASNLINFLLGSYWHIEAVCSVFLSVFGDYSDIMAGVGILVILLSSLLIVTTQVKSLEVTEGSNVTWLTNYLSYKSISKKTNSFRDYLICGFYSNK